MRTSERFWGVNRIKSGSADSVAQASSVAQANLAVTAATIRPTGSAVTI
jgi:hypothetical protein